MKITLKNVRLSFPALWKAKSVQGSAPKYGATLLMSKTEDAATISALKDAAKSVALAQWPSGIPKGCKNCVRDGSEKEFDGYGEGVMFVSASSDVRPAVVDQSRHPLLEEDGKPYAGCYVNAVIRLWAQDNSYGKRVNAQLCGIQFVRDGDAFGDKPFNAEEEFEDLSTAKATQKPAAAVQAESGGDFGDEGGGGRGGRGGRGGSALDDQDIPFAPNYL